MLDEFVDIFWRQNDQDLVMNVVQKKNGDTADKYQVSGLSN